MKRSRLLSICALALLVTAAGCHKKAGSPAVAAFINGLIQFTSANFPVGEGGGTATITIQRSGGSTGAVSVTITSSDGSATAGADYTAVTQIVSWAAGDTADKTVTIPITDDGAVEGDETVNLTLSLPTGGAVLGATNPAVLTIQDNDTPAAGVFQLTSATASVDEGDGSITFTVTRTGGSFGAVTVDYATSDNTTTVNSDYTDTNGTLSWAGGDSTPQTITIPILEDSLVEGDETLDLDLSNATGGAALVLSDALFETESEVNSRVL